MKCISSFQSHYDEDCLFRVVECPYDCGNTVIRKHEVDLDKLIMCVIEFLEVNSLQVFI